MSYRPPANLKSEIVVQDIATKCDAIISTLHTPNIIKAEIYKILKTYRHNNSTKSKLSQGHFGKIATFKGILKLFNGPHSSVMVTKADKGDWVVIMDKQDYIGKVSDLIESPG